MGSLKFMSKISTLGLVILSAVLFFCAFKANAATPDAPSYRKLTATPELPWTEGLNIFLDINEKLCSEKYGKKWLQKCAATAGKAGEIAQGISITPAVRGVWQWTGSTSLQFVPADGTVLTPNTYYKIDLANLYLPPSVSLDKTNISLKTKPLSARLLNLDFFIDPMPGGTHRLSCAITFNYPVFYNPEFKLVPSSAEIQYGTPEIVWNAERDRVNISWPIHKLSESSAQIAIIVPDMGQFTFENGEYLYSEADKKNSGAIFKKNIPAKSSLFFVREGSLRCLPDSQLDLQYVIKINTSLYASQEEVFKHLQIYELPQYNSEEAKEPYNWQLAPALDAEALKKSRKLKIIPLRQSKIPQPSQEFVIPVNQGRYVLCALDNQLTSASGLKLSRPWVTVLHAEPINPEVGFLHQGNVLSMKGADNLHLFGRGLDKIEWETKLLLDPYAALLASSSWNAFAAPFASISADPANFSVSLKGDISLKQAGNGQAQYANLNLLPILEQLRKKTQTSMSSGLLLLNLTGIKDNKPVTSAERLVLLSDIGILAKLSTNGQLRVFAHDLAQNKPASDLLVQVLGANGLPVADGKTDGEGQLLLPSLTGLEREDLPVALIAKGDQQFAWLPLNDQSRVLNYTDFPIEGAHIGPDDLNVYLFSQRDLYRPGDRMHFGCIVRKGNLDPLPDSIPLYAEIMDPRGSLLWQTVFNIDKPGMADFSWTIPEDAITGRYILNLRTSKKGPILQSGVYRVEEFQPETLKLKISPPAVKGWLQPASGETSVPLDFYLQNLYGTPAAGHEIRAELSLNPCQPRFKGFEDYRFPSLTIGSGNIQKKIGTIKTDQAGKASVALPALPSTISPMRLTISAEAFTAGGGRAVTAQTSVPVFSQPYILAYKTLGDTLNLEYVPRGANAAIQLVAINADLAQVPMEQIQLSLSRSTLSTSLIADGNGNYKYGDSPILELLKEWQCRLDKEGLKIKLDTEKVGDFILQVKDRNGALLHSIPYTVAGDAPTLPDTLLTASKIRMKLNKKSYDSGEKVKISLSLPYSGYGLMSLERDGAHEWKWFRAEAGESVHSFDLPPDFAGKGYLVVNFIRDLDSNRIYMSPLSYAIEPIIINSAIHDMKLKLEAAENINPGEELKIRLTSQKKGKAILYAVDEGILQLTNYQNPDPLKALLNDRALDVATIQALDLLMPVKPGKKQISAFGGGMGGTPFGNRFQNPFKRKNEAPVVACFPNLEIGEEPIELTLPIPDYYNGKIRLIALGAADTGVGSASKFVTIKAPFMISPQLPLYISPGDSFKGHLLLSNNSDEEQSWDISLSVPQDLNVISSDQSRVSLGKGQEKLWNFQLCASDKIGLRKLTFKATRGQLAVERSYSLSIRPLGTLYTSIKSGVISATEKLPASREVYKENAKSIATISTMPLVLAEGLGEYLSSYPFGCTEQLVSRSFSNLLLNPWLGKSGEQEKKLLSSTIGAIRARFNGSGVSLWNNGEPDLLLTAYAADFLLTLRKTGSANVDDLLTLLCDCLAENCALNESSLEAARASAYAIWVMTREGRITSQLIEELTRSLKDRSIPGWENDIAALLISASQKEMRMNPVLPDKKFQYQPSAFFDDFAQYALQMFILSQYFPELVDQEQKDTFYKESSAILNEGNFATFSAAQAIRAIAGLSAIKEGGKLSTHLQCAGKEIASSIWADGNAESVVTDICPRYEIRGDRSAPLFWQISTTGYDVEAPADSNSEGIIIEKTYLDNEGQEISNPALGQEVLVRIRARSAAGKIRDCVIADLLPGGLEMLFEKDDNRKLGEGIKYIDKQADRMLIFATLDSDPIEMVWKTRATTEGLFSVPPARAEDLYNRHRFGQTALQKVRIGHE